jgi:short-subunit dehydrogenase
MPFSLHGGVAVVTGAAKGIGAALAKHLASRHCHLALVDVDAGGLVEVAGALEQAGVRVTQHRLDVAAPHVPDSLREAVLEAHGRVNVLINNAGVALMGRFDQVSLADMEWLFEINFWGVVRMCKAFIPALQREAAAQIANLSSIYGLVAPAGQTAYAASKFAVRGFSEALAHELEQTSVRVSVVHPGGIRTTIAANARVPAAVDAREAADRAGTFLKIVRTSPDAAAERIVAGIERREPRILVGPDARRIDRLQRLLPVSYWAVMKRRAARLGLRPE